MANLALARKSPEWRSGLWGFDSFFFGDREQPHRLFIAEALFAMQAWVIRFAHPSGRAELRALLRYAPFLQGFISVVLPKI
jgi:hypothetical protein